MSRTLQHTDLKIRGMDCAECAMHVEAALGALAGVESAKVFFAAERAKVVYDEQQVDLDAFRAAVEKAGYHIAGEETARENRMPALLTLAFVGVVAAIIFVELVAERLGWMDRAIELIPWPVALAAILIGGLPVWRNVIADLRNRVVGAHALMTLGVIGATRAR